MNTEKKIELIDKIIEYGIYVYILIMFLSKFEGVRNILIFGNFALWLLTLKYRKNLHILKEPVSILFWIYTGLTICFVVFSIDPLYSFRSLRNDIIKPILLYVVIATVMSDRKRLEGVLYICCVAALVIVINGYYSYFFHDTLLLRGDTALMHTGNTGHGRLARYLNTLFPFMFILFYAWNRQREIRILLAILCVASVFAIVLTTSREAYLAFFSMVFIWAFYLSRKREYNFLKIAAGIIAVILLLGTLSWFTVPSFRVRMASTRDQLSTMNLRTEAWVPAMYAISQRPLTGWGHGKAIFRYDKPYKDTPYKKAPERKSNASPKGTHNTFIKIMFHQGIIGLLPYIVLLLLSIKVFWKDALNSTGIKSYILTACVAVLVGNFILNSMLADLQFRYMAVILALGMAARGINHDKV
jgi:O-antigen ligase